MALIQKTLPKCDVCGKPWLPDEFLRDGARNPAFDDPSLCKRCGKCKSSSWNQSARKKKPAPPPVTKADVMQTLDFPQKRCKHRLYNCPTCNGA